MMNRPYDAVSGLNGVVVPPDTSPLVSVMTVADSKSAGTVFHLIVIVPVVAVGPRRLVQLLVLPVSRPETEPLITCTAGLLPSGVALQPLSVPLSLIVSVIGPPGSLNDGTKPAVPLLNVSHVIV